MKAKVKTYKVKVETTNAANDTVGVYLEDEIKYYPCKNGILYVVTDDPRKIYNKFKSSVISIEEIGVGYSL